MIKKLFVSDLDGTLLKIKDEPSAGISDENRIAIKKFVENGNIFAVATARDVSYKVDLEERLGFKLDYIANNGAIICKNSEKKINLIPKEIMIEVIEIVKNENLNVTLCIKEENALYYIPTNSYPFDKIETKHRGDFLFEFGTEYKEGDYSIVKIRALVNPVEVEEIKKVLKNKLGNKLEIALSDKDLLDMTIKGCTKGSGVAELASMHGISDECVGVIGDSENDVSMFELYGHSYCMRLADSDVKSRAKCIVETVKEALEAFEKWD